MAYSLFYTQGEPQLSAEEQAEQAAREQRQEELRKRINEGLRHEIVKGKSGKGAGFAYAVTDHAFTGLTADSGTAFYAVPKIFMGRTAAEQMQAMEDRAGHPLLSGDDVNMSTIREGMVIGITANNQPGTGIDDVQRTGVVIRDPKTKQLVFAETGEDGKIFTRPVSELLEAAKVYDKKLYAGDLVELADDIGARPIQNFNYDRFHSRFATPDTAPSKAPVDLGAESTIRDRLSAGIEAYANDCIRRGVKYGFGDRSGSSRIDCSGFVHNAARRGYNDLETARGRRASPTALGGTSESQIDAVFRATGTMLRDNDVQVDTLKPGMLIGLDTGRKSWDRGRKRDIDHVVAVYKDSKTGKLMIAESCGGVGVRKMEAERWLERTRARHGNKLHLFATDLAEMADGQGLVAKADQPAAPATRNARSRQQTTGAHA
ncbi:MAG: hypothetical protein ACAH80_12160 [Alphaproteobacteria bacterium]